MLSGIGSFLLRKNQKDLQGDKSLGARGSFAVEAQEIRRKKECKSKGDILTRRGDFAIMVKL